MAALSTRAVGWHLASISAGAWGAMVFAQSGSVDIYALLAQLKKTWGDLVLLSGMVAPIMAAGAAAYRTYNQKQVSKDTVAVAPVAVDPGPDPHTAIVTGKIVGAFLLALIVFAPGSSQAQPINPLQRAPAILQNLRDTVIADLTAARDDAHSFNDPSEACWQVLLTHAQTMPPKLMGVAHTAQRLRDFRRGLPDVLDKCAVVKDGAKQALLQIFGTAIGGVSALAAFGF